MAQIPVQIYINGEKANPTWSQSLKEITVEQAQGQSAQARLLFPIVVNTQGAWTDLSGAQELSAGQRVRIVASSEGEMQRALIEGEVVEVESRQSAEPGQSLRVWVVKDDSALLHRDEGVWIFEKETPDQVARALFSELDPLFSDIQIEGRGHFQTPAPQALVHRGTRWELLKKMAQLHGVEVFVRPGVRLGTSKAFFIKTPREEDRKANLWINGPERNLDEVELLEDFQQAAQVKVHNLTLQQKQEFHHTADPGNAGRQALFHPEIGQATEASSYAESEVRRLNRDVLLKAKVRTLTYNDILEPYAWVKVGGLGERYSGDFWVRRVSHRFANGQWDQEVELLGWAQAKRKPSLAPAGRIY